MHEFSAMENDHTNKLERVEAFEERAGVRLEALCAMGALDTGWRINGNFEPGILTRRSRNQEVGADWAVWKRPFPLRLPSRVH
jgi:hypothetical protein